MLFACETCGRWQDVQLGNYLKTTWNNAMKNTPEAQIGQAGWPCPEGHGNMRQAQASDRLHILDAVMEVKKEGN